MSDKEKNVQNVDVEKEDNSTPWWVWVLLLFLVVLLIGGIFLFREIRQNVIAQTPAVESEDTVTDGENGEDIPTVRIPGLGSQKDHSGGLQFARINVHDDEAANQFGWYDRTIINTEDPANIGLDGDFTVPEGWTVERDYSLAKQEFQPYYTVKPLPTANLETINAWVEENNLQSTDYEVTSVVVDENTEQECSVRGLDDARVRTNIYVGEYWTFQTCPPTQDN